MSTSTSRTGNGGSPLSGGKTILMLRSGNTTVYILNCLHELGTAARHYRVGKTITMLRSGIICFLILQTIYTNGERRLADTPCNSKLLVKNHALHYNIRKR